MADFDKTFMDLHDDMVEVIKLLHMALRYRTMPTGAIELIDEAMGIIEDWRDWAKEVDKVAEKLHELAKAELEANYKDYFSVAMEDEHGQVWVPLDEVYDAVLEARHKAREEVEKCE